MVTLPIDASGRNKVSREPEAVMICCSFVPANCPRIACVIAADGWRVKAYMNREEVVVAILGCRRPDGLDFFDSENHISLRSVTDR